MFALCRQTVSVKDENVYSVQQKMCRDGLEKSRRMKWVGYVARVAEKRCEQRDLVVRRDGNTPLGRPRNRWNYNIKMDLKDVE